MTEETKSGLGMKEDKMSETSKEMKTDSEVYEQKAKIPDFIGQTCLSVLVFIMGASMRGKLLQLLSLFATLLMIEIVFNHVNYR